VLYNLLYSTERGELVLDQTLHSLFELMKTARDKSERVNALAYDLRQKALRLQFEAASAIETADVAAEILKESRDTELMQVVVKSSLEATKKAADSTLKAIVALEEANEAEKQVTETFLIAKDAAEKLSEALKRVAEDVNLAN
jgi:ABC-type arginine transport system ATPase subunit